jgi:formylglycine-generating enzyme required for sulfatase activity
VTWTLLPVLVTNREAEAYARWADKALPSEEQWEKAARGEGVSVYPWGDGFDPEKVNSAEFWASETVGKALKMRYGVNSPGLLPVDSLPQGASPFGAVNMSGNALEWTSSWYRPYRGNSRIIGAYGTQYKVLRGGEFCSDRHRIRITNREIGATPNRDLDFVAGFRCAREARATDRDAASGE